MEESAHKVPSLCLRSPRSLDAAQPFLYGDWLTYATNVMTKVAIGDELRQNGLVERRWMPVHKTARRRERVNKSFW